MKPLELVTTAISNTFRSRVRTLLTVLAIFVGAFTLTLTNGVGVGIKGYIASQIAAMGGSDLMSVAKTSTVRGAGLEPDSGPREYDPDASFFTVGGGMQFEALSAADVKLIEELPGVASVEPLRVIAPDYITYQDGRKFELTVPPTPAGIDFELAAGAPLSKEGATAVAGMAEPVGELLLPSSYVEPMGFASQQDAVGKVVTIVVPDPFGNQHEVPALVRGVMNKALFGDSVIISGALRDTLFAEQTKGLPAFVTNVYQGATVHMTDNSPETVRALKRDLRENDLTGITIEDQLGSIDTVITGLVWVLNGFAIIALVAAGFGIVNTLLMAVQERTREIGLMKALGLGAGRIFALFSAEAAFIGFLGSALGTLLGIAVGTYISNRLSAGPLKDLEGLRVLAFDPLQVGGVILLVMFLALVAGTLPAAKAARQDPIDALRYE